MLIIWFVKILLDLMSVPVLKDTVFTMKLETALVRYIAYISDQSSLGFLYILFVLNLLVYTLFGSSLLSDLFSIHFRY